MKKLLAVAAAAGALALVGCGSDVTDAITGDSCQTTTAGVQASGSGCSTLAPGTTVTVLARPTCQSCKDSRPGCTPEVRAGGDIELDTIYRQCSADAGCASTSCGFTPIECVFTTPSASGQYRFVYPRSERPGDLGSRDVVVAPGGATSCTL